jgi:hypothetical protein
MTTIWHWYTNSDSLNFMVALCRQTRMCVCSTQYKVAWHSEWRRLFFGLDLKLNSAIYSTARTSAAVEWDSSGVNVLPFAFPFSASVWMIYVTSNCHVKLTQFTMQMTVLFYFETPLTVTFLFTEPLLKCFTETDYSCGAAPPPPTHTHMNHVH